MKILIMMTSNWNTKLGVNPARDLAEEIDMYIGNTGNLMFMNACDYYVNQPENEYTYYNWYEMNDNPKRYKDMINHQYDLVVYPLANVLQSNTTFLNNVLRLLDGITIPIVCMGIGLSVNKTENIDALSKQISEPVSKFVKLIVNHGGMFGCRGYYTKELLDKFAPADSSVVIGCPSMYQNGILRINKSDMDKSFRVGINGRVSDFGIRCIKKGLIKYNSVYIDQDEFCTVLYGKSMTQKQIVKRYTHLGAKLLEQDRVKLFYSLPDWYQYICENIDFTYGTRIHGNLITLLAGKPAVVCISDKNRDIRVMELAEFFEIPICKEKTKDPYDILLQADYGMFNKNFENKFNNFKKFLVDNHICNNLSCDENKSLHKADMNEMKGITNEE